jgi:hypothetical protein
MDKERGVFEVEAEWLHSYEADQHLKHIGHSDSHVCWTMTGYGSGHASAVFGSEVCCFEKRVRWQGRYALSGRCASGVKILCFSPTTLPRNFAPA